MIRRETLLKNARDLAVARAQARPSVAAVYLAGSVARGEPLLGGVTDLDLIVIDDPAQADGPLPAPEDVRLTPEIIAEIVYRRLDFFRNTGALRDHPYLGPEIFEGVALYDPAHVFDRLQAGVRGRYDQPAHIFTRAQISLEWAQDELAVVLPCLEKPGPEPPSAEQLSRFLHALLFSANAVLLLAGGVGSNRRLMSSLELAAHSLGQPALYVQFAQTMSADALTPDKTEEMLSIWAALYEAMVEFHTGDWGEDYFVQPVRRAYYERALRALTAEGAGPNMAWLYLHTANACLNQIRRGAPPGALYLYEEKWERVLERLRLRSALDFAQAIGLARDYLEAVTEFVERWGESEGA